MRVNMFEIMEWSGIGSLYGMFPGDITPILFNCGAPTQSRKFPNGGSSPWYGGLIAIGAYK
jgi:hypothetical protein